MMEIIPENLKIGHRIILRTSRTELRCVVTDTIEVHGVYRVKVNGDIEGDILLLAEEVVEIQDENLDN